MANDHDGYVKRFRQGHEVRCTLSHLADTPRCGRQLSREDRLDGIDDEHTRLQTGNLLADQLHRRLSENVDMVTVYS